MLVTENEELQVYEQKTYVSRGGVKLAFALDNYAINVAGLDCLDVGTGSGGFTDCLLKRGARSVTAIDVGYGQFDWRLRQDSRVKLFERTNFRYFPLPEANALYDLVVVDLSFTKTSALIAKIKSLINSGGQTIILIKPQFELSANQAASEGFQAGIVLEEKLHQEVLEQFLKQATLAGLVTYGLCPSPIKGADGNSEFLFWAKPSGIGANIDIEKVVRLSCSN